MGWIVGIAILALVAGIEMCMVGFSNDTSDLHDSLDARKAQSLFIIGIPLAVIGATMLVGVAAYLILRFYGLT